MSQRHRMKDDDFVRVTSPGVLFTQTVSLIGTPAILSILFAGGVRGQQMLRATVVVLSLSTLAILWSFLNNIETTLVGRKLTRTRRLGPFRVSQTIDVSDIEALRIPPYSGQLGPTHSLRRVQFLIEQWRNLRR